MRSPRRGAHPRQHLAPPLAAALLLLSFGLLVLLAAGLGCCWLLLLQPRAAHSSPPNTVNIFNRSNLRYVTQNPSTCENSKFATYKIYSIHSQPIPMQDRVVFHRSNPNMSNSSIPQQDKILEKFMKTEAEARRSRSCTCMSRGSLTAEVEARSEQAAKGRKKQY